MFFITLRPTDLARTGWISYPCVMLQYYALVTFENTSLESCGSSNIDTLHYILF